MSRRFVPWVVSLVVLAVIFQLFFRHQHLPQVNQQTIFLGRNDAGVSSSPPIPVPSATNCDMFQQMYPPTQQAFNKQHLSTKQQAEVLKWVAKMSTEDRRYAKWWLAPSSQYGNLLLVFSTNPVRETWETVNRNVWINPKTCEWYPYPGA